MNVPSLQPHLRADQLTLEQLEKNPNLSKKEKVAEASRQFEAVLLRQILTQIRKPVFQSFLSSNSAASSIYQDMINYQMAETVSKAGTLGLAQSLESQLDAQLLKHPNSAPPGAQDATAKKPVNKEPIAKDSPPAPPAKPAHPSHPSPYRHRTPQ